MKRATVVDLAGNRRDDCCRDAELLEPVRERRAVRVRAVARNCSCRIVRIAAVDVPV
ncbi:MAG: hypothetical protein M3R26_00265 [Actinomycetota bacterium]|nr:hypothetical protein [Actinomycetota bacterium]MDQ2980747.1 hypothetical protein [Actinomycetota bacterium]